MSTLMSDDIEEYERRKTPYNPPSVEHVRVEEYPGSGGWRWRLQDPGNNEILDAATQGFSDRAEARENFRRIYRLVGGTRAIWWVEVSG